MNNAMTVRAKSQDNCKTKEQFIHELQFLRKQIADSACYAAKNAGRSRVHVYHRDDTDFARRLGETGFAFCAAPSPRNFTCVI